MRRRALGQRPGRRVDVDRDVVAAVRRVRRRAPAARPRRRRRPCRASTTPRARASRRRATGRARGGSTETITDGERRRPQVDPAADALPSITKSLIATTGPRPARRRRCPGAAPTSSTFVPAAAPSSWYQRVESLPLPAIRRQSRARSPRSPGARRAGARARRRSRRGTRSRSARPPRRAAGSGGCRSSPGRGARADARSRPAGEASAIGGSARSGEPLEPNAVRSSVTRPSAATTPIRTRRRARCWARRLRSRRRAACRERGEAIDAR